MPCTALRLPPALLGSTLQAKLTAFIISAVYASASGSLLAMQNRPSPLMAAGDTHSIELVTMAVLGGAGSVLGAIFGAGILTLLPQALMASSSTSSTMLGLIMMLVMIFLRQGLLPSLIALVRGRG